MIKLSAAARGLVWREWDDTYIVYQPSSAETHVFNKTTTLILRCLEAESLSDETLKEGTEKALGVRTGEIAPSEFSFALERLEELGLIERY
jgi:PqqD family protein of HPr-rel-A system